MLVIMKRYKDFGVSTKARVNKAWNRSHLKRMGWTPESVAKAKIEQGGLCSICKQKRPIFPDHKHTVPPTPRSLLCRQCNVAIGHFSESPELCEAAAKYLRYWCRPCGRCGSCLDCLRDERNQGAASDL